MQNRDAPPDHWLLITNSDEFLQLIVTRAARERMVTISQAAKALGTFPAQIRGWANAGVISAVHMPAMDGKNTRNVLHVDLREARHFQTKTREVRRQIFRDQREGRGAYKRKE